MRIHLVLCVIATMCLSACVGTAGHSDPMEKSAMNHEANRIQPWVGNRFYWQYQGKPVILLGGSSEDNLFQVKDVEKELDKIQDSGGNYVRCTMSSRDEGDVWPFGKDETTGKYDLRKPGEEYWGRFERFVEACEARGIILQIELWDRFDFAREPWQANPYNPKNNINYTVETSGLQETIDTHPGKRESAFFRSVPALENNVLILQYQQTQVDRLLSITLRHPNVLYCMDNETNESPEWGAYWSRYLHEAAKRAGMEVQCTEMWDEWSLEDDQHKATLDHPETYEFVDVSQNNHNSGDRHWEMLQHVRDRIKGDKKLLRPMNMVKVYGSDKGPFGNTRDGKERFWRSLLGGIAGVRFHRPTSGLGSTDEALANMRSARMVVDCVDLMGFEPANQLLRERSENEAFCTASREGEYVVYAPGAMDVMVDVSAGGGGRMEVKWLRIEDSRWTKSEVVAVEDDLIHLVNDDGGSGWAIIAKPLSRATKR